MQDEFLGKLRRWFLYVIPHHEILLRRVVFHLMFSFIDRDTGAAQLNLDLKAIMRLFDLRVVFMAVR